MKFWEAMKALQEGKKVQQSDWGNEWIALNDNNIEDELGDHFEFKHLKIFDAWQIYEEPKPEIKLIPEMVGRKVRLMNGAICIIDSYRSPDYHICYGYISDEGKFLTGPENYDIIEIMPKD